MSKRYARQLHSADGLIAAVEQYGFLPFFRNEIHGFSIEELCPPELWFADDVDGPWEWKGPAARSGKCLYGKLFNKKAGFVSREWIPDFANFRRDGYDFIRRHRPHQHLDCEAVERNHNIIQREIPKNIGTSDELLYTAMGSPFTTSLQSHHVTQQSHNQADKIRISGSGYNTDQGTHYKNQE